MTTKERLRSPELYGRRITRVHRGHRVDEPAPQRIALLIVETYQVPRHLHLGHPFEISQRSDYFIRVVHLRGETRAPLSRLPRRGVRRDARMFIPLALLRLGVEPLLFVVHLVHLQELKQVFQGQAGGICV